MITQIDVMSDDNFILPIIGLTPKSSLLIKKITGLNPPNRTLFIGDYSQDGGVYQGRRVGNRNVVMTIDLNPNPALGETVSKLRKKLHKAFIDPQPEGDYLKVVLHDDEGNEIYFVGYCDNFEGEIFDPTTMCQISMMCPDPFLRDNQDTILTHASGWVEVPFTYQGTAETGFVVRIYLTVAATALTLSNNGKTMQLVNPSGYAVGDVVIINTIRGQRSINHVAATALTSTPTEFVPPAAYASGAIVFYNAAVWKAVTSAMAGGTTWADAPSKSNDNWELISTPIVAQLLATSQWLELHSAANSMRVYEGEDPSSVIANIKYLKYTSAYWGV